MTRFWRFVEAVGWRILEVAERKLKQDDPRSIVDDLKRLNRPNERPDRVVSICDARPRRSR